MNEDNNKIKSYIKEDQKNRLISKIKEEDTPDTWELTKVIVRKSFSYSFNHFQFYLQFMIIIIFIGNIYHDTSMINAFGLVHLMMLILNNYLIGTFTNSFEILGENYFKSKNYSAFGILYQKTQLLSGFTSIIISLVLYAITKVVVNSIGIDIVTKGYVNDYINIALIFPVFQIQNNIHYTYLKIVDKLNVDFTLVLFHLGVFTSLCFLFILTLELKLTGVGLSYLISNVITYICYILYIHVEKPFPKTIIKLEESSFSKWSILLTNTFEVTMYDFLDKIAFEFLTFISFLAGSLAFTVYLILYSIYQLMYAFTVGLSKTCETMSKDLMSEGRKESAKTVFFVTLILISIITKLFTIITLILLGLGLTYTFIIDQYIANFISTAQYPLVFALISHSMTKMFLSFFNGIGLYSTSGLVNVIGLYLLNIPLSICFGVICKTGSIGIFISLIISTTIQFLICWAVYEYYIDFDKIDFKKLRKNSYINDIGSPTRNLIDENDENVVLINNNNSLIELSNLNIDEEVEKDNTKKNI